MASSRSPKGRGFNTLTRKIPYGRILRQIIVVGMPRKHVFIVYRR